MEKKEELTKIGRLGNILGIRVIKSKMIKEITLMVPENFDIDKFIKSPK